MGDRGREREHVRERERKRERGEVRVFKGQVMQDFTTITHLAKIKSERSPGYDWYSALSLTSSQLNGAYA